MGPAKLPVCSSHLYFSPPQKKKKKKAGKLNIFYEFNSTVKVDSNV